MELPPTHQPPCIQPAEPKADSDKVPILLRVYGFARFSADTQPFFSREEVPRDMVMPS